MNINLPDKCPECGHLPGLQRGLCFTCVKEGRTIITSTASFGQATITIGLKKGDEVLWLDSDENPSKTTD